MSFLKVIALIAGFIIAGAAGGVAALSGVPQLRESCEHGVVCFILRLSYFSPSRTQAQGDSKIVTVETTADCLSKRGRLIVYRMGVILVGDPAPKETDVPASLDLDGAACVPVEKVAANVCASLARVWSTPEACVLQPDNPAR